MTERVAIKRNRRVSRAISIARALLLLLALAAPLAARAQDDPKDGTNEPGARPNFEPGAMVTLDFADAELAQVIETIARATNRNFIYDDRVRGRVTIVSPDPIPVEQAYAVFESVLQVKGFTTVMTPGGAIKVIPVREAKESSIETVRSSQRPPNRDTFVTRLIPLRYIDADSIVNTLKPLVSKDAAMAAYSPTNTVILTESASNIRRLIAILESIDVETYKQDLAVINVEFADATTLADQVSEIYGAEVAEAPGGAFNQRRAARRVANPAEPNAAAGGGPTQHRPPVRIITDERTNSLLVLAPRAQLEEVRRLIAKLDVPVPGGGRIHVYYLNNAKAEDLAQTLSALVGGSGGGGGTSRRSTTGGTRRSPSTLGGNTAQQRNPLGGGVGGLGGITAGGAPSIQSEVAGLEGGVSISADAATNSLIIQASQEGFNTLAGVIAKLDVVRPQVSVEALIMELTVNDNVGIGFRGLMQAIDGNQSILLASATSAAGAAVGAPVAPSTAGPLLAQVFKDTRSVDSSGNRVGDGSVIDSIIDLSAKNGNINIVSAPHILTSDNEEAEIRVGDNIPIISSRVQSAQGVTTASTLATSVNVERQDIGVTLRVTPQITEGDSLRLEIFQELTAINSTLQSGVGNVNDVGPALSNRRVENTVVVRDGETVVIGGLLSDTTSDDVTKVPWLGDIPFLGWLFKSTTTQTTKTNLLVFLTPHIVRTPTDLENNSIRLREEFENHSGRPAELSQEDLDEEAKRYALAKDQGVPYIPRHYDLPVREELAGHEARYPVARIKEIEAVRAEERARAEASRAGGPRYLIQAATMNDADKAAALLTDLIDSGHDGTLVSSPMGDNVVYEIQLGPFDTLEQANAVGNAIKKSHNLTPAIIVLEPEKKDE